MTDTHFFMSKKAKAEARARKKRRKKQQPQQHQQRQQNQKQEEEEEKHEVEELEATMATATATTVVAALPLTTKGEGSIAGRKRKSRETLRKISARGHNHNGAPSSSSSSSLLMTGKNWLRADADENGDSSSGDDASDADTSSSDADDDDDDDAAAKTTKLSLARRTSSAIRIRIPPGLKGKELRKFRKDARRKARVVGSDPTFVRFVSSSFSDNDDGDDHDDDNSGGGDMDGDAKVDVGSAKTTKKRKKSIDESDIHDDDEGGEEREEVMPERKRGKGNGDNSDTNDKKTITKKAKSYNPSSSAPFHAPTLEQGQQNRQQKQDQHGRNTMPLYPRINDLIAADEARRQYQKEEESRKQAIESVPSYIKDMYVAIDCEMVGIGPGGKTSVLARVSVVNWSGNVLLDTFVQVPDKVTDYRTFVSGVTANDLRPPPPDTLDDDDDDDDDDIYGKQMKNKKKKKGAMTPTECRLIVSSLLDKKILVGHGLSNDLKALLLSHPRTDTRDTSQYRPFMRQVRIGGRGGKGKFRSRKLRDLTLEYLGLVIQEDGKAHSSIDDARAAMELYKFARKRWEKDLDARLRKKKGNK